MKNRNMKKKSKKKGGSARCYFVRAGRSGRQDLTTRIPELLKLQDKTVTVIGAGCLGAPSILEFARNGVGKLRIIDFDVVEAGTIIRWPFGIHSVGNLKTKVLNEFIKNNYPFTKVEELTKRIGEVRESPSQISDLDILNQALNNTDLIYDASAEIGIQHLLSDLAKENNIPYLSISTTYGAWGGIILRIRPQKTEGCWNCYMNYLNDGHIPTPYSDPAGEVQPMGCASPTFTGSSFDSGMIALGGVRLAMSTLTENEEKGYPKFEWDAAIINMRDQNGNAITPSWQTFEIKKHPSCPC
jgi:molybdopterin/thiamine biosynthesis adenylyltransferase